MEGLTLGDFGIQPSPKTCPNFAFIIYGKHRKHAYYSKQEPNDEILKHSFSRFLFALLTALSTPLVWDFYCGYALT
jgi:hypothetical protein